MKITIFVLKRLRKKRKKAKKGNSINIQQIRSWLSEPVLVLKMRIYAVFVIVPLPSRYLFLAKQNAAKSYLTA